MYTKYKITVKVVICMHHIGMPNYKNAFGLLSGHVSQKLTHQRTHFTVNRKGTSHVSLKSLLTYPRKNSLALYGTYYSTYVSFSSTHTRLL